MKFNTIFKGLWTLIFVPVVMAANVIVSVIFSPKTAVSQVEKTAPIPTSTDTSMSLAEARDIFSYARENKIRVDKLVDNKETKKESKPKVVIKEIIKKVPVYRDKIIYKDSIFVSNGIGVEKPLIVYRDARVYGGDSLQPSAPIISRKRPGVIKFFENIFKNKRKNAEDQDTIINIENETKVE